MPENSKDPLSKYFSQHTHYSKSDDDMLDIHVGNPLHKIVILLEEIKRQKAFSFTLKGSLGIAGVVLTLSLFGLFGGGKLLCEKGSQTHIGTIRFLEIKDADQLRIPFLSNFTDVFDTKSTHKRVVLVQDNNSIVRIPFNDNVDLETHTDNRVFATGNYDSCSQTLKVEDSKGIENEE